ncbi:hypothetical protein B296_00020811 [Ensete ventricosum]|uniref:Uncharacterized protein n=1 Tax=Ensete ventricosum TaxID=4639 RepID=A0A426ZM17_ENSVE|nr:hypothetical protein B296_00020811 [Ensete ventricosum]
MRKATIRGKSRSTSTSTLMQFQATLSSFDNYVGVNVDAERYSPLIVALLIYNNHSCLPVVSYLEKNVFRCNEAAAFRSGRCFLWQTMEPQTKKTWYLVSRKHHLRNKQDKEACYAENHRIQYPGKRKMA